MSPKGQKSKQSLWGLCQPFQKPLKASLWKVPRGEGCTPTDFSQRLLSANCSPLHSPSLHFTHFCFTWEKPFYAGCSASAPSLGLLLQAAPASMPSHFPRWEARAILGLSQELFHSILKSLQVVFFVPHSLGLGRSCWLVFI